MELINLERCGCDAGIYRNIDSMVPDNKCTRLSTREEWSPVSLKWNIAGGSLQYLNEFETVALPHIYPKDEIPFIFLQDDLCIEPGLKEITGAAVNPLYIKNQTLRCRSRVLRYGVKRMWAGRWRSVHAVNPDCVRFLAGAWKLPQIDIWRRSG